VFSYEQFQDKLKGEEVEIYFSDKKFIHAKQIEISLDSVSYINLSDSILSRVPLISISTVRRRLYSDGRTEGFVFGSLLGCIVGAGVGAIGSDDGEMSGLGAIVTGLGGMLIGCTVGTTWGASRGHVVDYEFKMDSIMVK
jgi:hypothetical protein